MQLFLRFLSLLTSLASVYAPQHSHNLVNIVYADTSRYEFQNASFVETKTGVIETYSFASLGIAIAANKPARILLGQSALGREIPAFFFPGISTKRALVIGGVHGSELSAIEVARELITSLQLDRKPFYSVIVIPCLFPDNAELALDHPEETGSVLNIGRYSHGNGVDPNRQMPSPGKPYDESNPLDHLGRTIEPENQLLLQLLQSFRPARIVNLHAIRNTGYGGVYADPRTDENGIALGYETDSSLALEMAKFIERQGGNVLGNHLQTKPSALYYKDPVAVAAGLEQKRNMTGSALAAQRGGGVSLGTWASTAVLSDAKPDLNRDAMRIITMEFPGSRRPVDYSNPQQRQFFQQQVQLFAGAVMKIFLGNYFLEEKRTQPE